MTSAIAVPMAARPQAAPAASGSRVLVIGGSGFVGSHLAQRLSLLGVDVLVPTRRRERAKPLLVLPTVEVIEADVRRPNILSALMRRTDAVVNLVGVLRGGNGRPYGDGFRRAHVELPEKIAMAMRQAGLRRLVHVSALQAGADAPSGYLRSKYAGEEALRRAGLDLTVLRPSVIFGSGDSFLSLFARLLRFAPVLPLACPQARFQPVWVGDVAAAIADCLFESAAIGGTFELCGPRRYALHELVAYVGRLSRRSRPVVGLSDSLSWLQAALLELVPGGPMSRDNYLSMKVDSVCGGACTLPFDRVATPLEAVAPTYVGIAVGARANYPRYRHRAGR